MTRLQRTNGSLSVKGQDLANNNNNYSSIVFPCYLRHAGVSRYHLSGDIYDSGQLRLISWRYRLGKTIVGRVGQEE